MSTTILPKRECGWRTAGGVYLVSPTDRKLGHPIKEFLVDPPIMVPDPESLGISKLGVKLIMDPKTGITNVWDWVGSDYPTIARYVEEAKALGVSRHVAANLQWDRLDRRSSLILLHPRAFPSETPKWFSAELATALSLGLAYSMKGEATGGAGYDFEGVARCTQRVGKSHCGRPMVGDHDNDESTPPAMCSRLWWQAEDPKTGEVVHPEAPRLRKFDLACGRSYMAMTRPEEVVERFMPGIFMRVPLAIEVIRDPQKQVHQTIIDRIRKATDLQVTEQDG